MRPPPPVRQTSNRLFLAAGAALALVVALTVVGLDMYAAATRAVDRSLEVQETAHVWLVALVDAETGVRGYIATGDAVFLEPYREGVAHEPATAQRMREIAATEETQRANVARAEGDARTVLDQLAEYVDLVGAGRRDEATAQLATTENKIRMDMFRADVAAIEVREGMLLAARRLEVSSRASLALGGAGLLSLAGFALLWAAWRRERGHQVAIGVLATEARARLQALSDIAARLSEVRTRSEVARTIVDDGARAVGADTCTVHFLVGGDASLELIAHRGVAPEIVESIRRLSPDDATYAPMQSAKPVWAETAADYARTYPTLASAKATGQRARAFFSIPLVAEGRPLGLLGAGSYAPRSFPDEERAFIETVANHCAQALLRATHLEREEEARQWFTTTLKSIGDAVIATDGAGLVTFMNQVAEGLTGWTEADARGLPLTDVFAIFSEITREPVESPVEKVLREGTVVGLANHTLLRQRSGREVPIDDSGAPIRDEAGRMIGVVLVFRDASEKYRASARREFLAKAGEALASSLDYETTLSTVASLAVPSLADWCAVELVVPGARAPRQVAVAHVDPEKVRHAKELGERYPPDPAATGGTAEAIRTGRAILYAEIPPELVERGARDAAHLRLLRDLRLTSAIIVPLTARGRAIGAITFVYAESNRRYGEDDLRFAEDFARRAAMAIENASALRETEAARAKETALRRDAELASRAKDEFLATVSHELRTPLNAILGYTMMLRRRTLDAPIDHALGIIERNARSQTKLIEDVLDVSRIISGKLSLHLGPAVVAEAIASAVETVTPAAEAKGITLSSDVGDPTFAITADANRLQQIVWNLLANAVKFTPKGGRVSVRAEQVGSNVVVSVTDTGEGIRPEALAYIFEPFQQADASTTRRHGGLGLGLAIVRQLVTAHGGTVRAESEGEGRGATFVVHLPARAAVSAVTSMPRSSEPAGERPSMEAPRLEGACVLVVDDEVDARELLAEILRDRGAVVHLAASAQEALDALAALRPDVLVSDIGMPGEDGLSLIRKIRGLPEADGGRVPAIALSAFAHANDALRSTEAGFVLHLAKPVELEELVGAIVHVWRGAPGPDRVASA